MKSAVTVSLVPEAKGGPFVFWDNLAAACAQARELGFDAVEIFPPSADSLKLNEVRSLLARHHLQLAAIGTGAGWVRHKLRLTDPDPAIRRQAVEFVRPLIATAGSLGAPAIIGSMQGRCDAGRARALQWLGDALQELSAESARHHQVLLFEPLNRYETDVFNRQGEAGEFLRGLATRNIRLLCDLFHMNLEERCLASALQEAGPLVGHIHWADSNRLAMGGGHTDAASVIASLRAIGYTGYLSAEVLPLPDSAAAARQSMESFRRWTIPAQ
jgi:sugar phosphate isomerase/epimerase